jgi:ABC-type lipoprotein release transport system permease subunit
MFQLYNKDNYIHISLYSQQPFSYDEWIAKKKHHEQKGLDIIKAREEKKRLVEEERYIHYHIFVFTIFLIDSVRF